MTVKINTWLALSQLYTLRMADSVLQLTVTSKRKRPHTDFKLCIYCQKSNDTGVKLHNMTEDGYGSLFYAVQNRDDDI